VHTEFHDMVTKAVTKAFDGLTAGTKEVPAPPPGDPVRHPSPPVHRPVVVDPAHPAPDWGPARPASRAPRLSIPLQPPPPRPAPGPPPAPPPTPRPWRPGGPGIGGPGGL
jgi:hypothetical protein